MDVNIKNEFDFEKYYKNEYNCIISNYYESVKNKRTKIIVFKIIFSIILSAFVIGLINIFNIEALLNNYYSVILIIYFIVIFSTMIMSIKKSLDCMMLELNEYIIKDMIAFVSNNDVSEIMYEPEKMVSRDSFDKMELFNLDVVKYNGKNYIKVLYNKNSMVFSDIETYIIDTVETKKEIYKDGKKYIRTTRKKKKRIIFKGLYIGATINKENTNHIYLIPNNLNDTVLQSKIMNYISYHGVPVNLENLEFSKKYKVFCDNEVQARYILSLSLMEKINKLDELYKGKKYIVFKEGKRFAICIEGISIENLKKIKLPAFRNNSKEFTQLNSIFSNINDLFKIYYILDLKNDLYTKYIDKPISNTNIIKPDKNAFIQQETQIKVGTLSNREKLLKLMQLQDNIRQLSQQSTNKVLMEKIININDVICDIQVEQSEYHFSNRQMATIDNTINSIKSKQFLDAYYEIVDFIEDYGNKHNGIVYEAERKEILYLIQILEKNMREQTISKNDFFDI